MAGQPELTDTEQVFRVGNRPLVLIALFVAFLAVLPANSLYELITTGTIDLEAVGKGRRAIPNWQVYAIGWILGAPLIWASLRVLMRYLPEREMFRLGPQGITIRSETIAPEEVQGFATSFRRGHVLRTTRGDFPFHPLMVKGAPEALALALPHVPPLKNRDIAAWALGD